MPSCHRGPFLLTELPPEETPSDEDDAAILELLGYSWESPEDWGKAKLPTLKLAVEEKYFRRGEVSELVAAAEGEALASKYVKINASLRRGEEKAYASWTVFRTKEKLRAAFRRVFPQDEAERLEVRKCWSKARLPNQAPKQLADWCQKLAQAINTKEVLPKHVAQALRCFLPEDPQLVIGDYKGRKEGEAMKDTKSKDSQKMKDTESKESKDDGKMKDTKSKESKGEEKMKDTKSKESKGEEKMKDTRSKESKSGERLGEDKAQEDEKVKESAGEKEVKDEKARKKKEAKDGEKKTEAKVDEKLAGAAAEPAERRPNMTFRQFWDLGAEKAAAEARLAQEKDGQEGKAAEPAEALEVPADGPIKDVPCSLSRRPMVDVQPLPEDGRPLMTFRQFWDAAAPPAAPDAAPAPDGASSPSSSAGASTPPGTPSTEACTPEAKAKSGKQVDESSLSGDDDDAIVKMALRDGATVGAEKPRNGAVEEDERIAALAREAKQILRGQK